MPQVDELWVDVKGRTDFSQAEREALQSGQRAGEAFAQGYRRNSDGRLVDDQGKFVSEGRQVGGAAGDAAGREFGQKFGAQAGAAISEAAQNSSARFAGILAAIGGAATVAGLGLVKLGGQMEQTRTGFTTLLGSAEEAQAFLEEIADFAARTPFELTGLQDSSKKLLAFGFEARQIIPMMTALGDAVSALGGGKAEIDRVTLALGQMSAKGKVSAEEMGQLAELGIPAWQLLADEMGKSIAETMDAAQKGAISAAEALPALLQGMQEKFGGGMAAQSQTLLGMWSNTMDTLEQASIKAGEAITEALDLKGVLGMVNEAIATLPAMFEDLDLEAWATENRQAITMVAGAVVGMLTPALIAGATAAWAFVAPLLPWAAAGAAVALILSEMGVSLADLQAGFGAATAYAGPLLESLQEMGADLQQRLAPVFGMLAEAARSGLSAISGVVTGVLLPAFQSMMPTLGPLLSAFGNLVASVAGVVRDAFALAAAAVQTVLIPAFQMIWPIVQPILAFIGERLAVQMNFIAGVFKTAGALMRGDWAAAWDGIKTTFRDAIGDLVDSGRRNAQRLLDAGKQMGQAIVGGMSGVFNTIGSLITGKILEGIEALQRVLPARLAGLLDGLAETLEGATSRQTARAGQGFQSAQQGAAALANTANFNAFMEALGLAGRRISQEFGSTAFARANSHLRGYEGGIHRGLDVAAPVGTRLFSPVNGRAQLLLGENDGYGNMVRLIDEQGRQIILAHMEGLSSALRQQAGRNGGWVNVAAGTFLGTSGNTGNSTNPHIHIEVRGADGRPIDPRTLAVLAGVEAPPRPVTVQTATAAPASPPAQPTQTDFRALFGGGAPVTVTEEDTKKAGLTLQAWQQHGPGALRLVTALKEAEKSGSDAAILAARGQIAAYEALGETQKKLVGFAGEVYGRQQSAAQEAARLTEQQRQQEERSEREAQQRAQRMNQARIAGNLDALKLALQETEQLRERDLQRAGDNAERRLLVEQRYASRLYEGRVALARMERQIADRQVGQNPDLDGATRKRQLDNNAAAERNAIQRAATQRVAMMAAANQAVQRAGEQEGREDERRQQETQRRLAALNQAARAGRVAEAQLELDELRSLRDAALQQAGENAAARYRVEQQFNQQLLEGEKAILVARREAAKADVRNDTTLTTDLRQDALDRIDREFAASVRNAETAATGRMTAAREAERRAEEQAAERRQREEQQAAQTRQRQAEDLNKALASGNIAAAQETVAAIRREQQTLLNDERRTAEERVALAQETGGRILNAQRRVLEAQRQQGYAEAQRAFDRRASDPNTDAAMNAGQRTADRQRADDEYDRAWAAAQREQTEVLTRAQRDQRQATEAHERTMAGLRGAALDQQVQASRGELAQLQETQRQRLEAVRGNAVDEARVRAEAAQEIARAERAVAYGEFLQAKRRAEATRDAVTTDPKSGPEAIAAAEEVFAATNTNITRTYQQSVARINATAAAAGTALTQATGAALLELQATLGRGNVTLAQQQLAAIEGRRTTELDALERSNKSAEQKAAERLAIERRYGDTIYQAQKAIAERQLADANRAAAQLQGPARLQAEAIASNAFDAAMDAAEKGRDKRLADAQQASTRLAEDTARALARINAANTQEMAANNLQVEKDLQAAVTRERETAWRAAGDNLEARAAVVEQFAEREIAAAQRVAQAELILAKRRNEAQRTGDRERNAQSLTGTALTDANADAEARYLERNAAAYRAYGVAVAAAGQQVLQLGEAVDAATQAEWETVVRQSEEAAQRIAAAWREIDDQAEFEAWKEGLSGLSDAHLATALVVERSLDNFARYNALLGEQKKRADEAVEAQRTLIAEMARVATMRFTDTQAAADNAIQQSFGFGLEGLLSAIGDPRQGLGLDREATLEDFEGTLAQLERFAPAFAAQIKRVYAEPIRDLLGAVGALEGQLSEAVPEEVGAKIRLMVELETSYGTGEEGLLKALATELGLDVEQVRFDIASAFEQFAAIANPERVEALRGLYKAILQPYLDFSARPATDYFAGLLGTPGTVDAALEKRLNTVRELRELAGGEGPASVAALIGKNLGMTTEDVLGNPLAALQRLRDEMPEFAQSLELVFAAVVKGWGDAEREAEAYTAQQLAAMDADIAQMERVVQWQQRMFDQREMDGFAASLADLDLGELTALRDELLLNPQNERDVERFGIVVEAITERTREQREEWQRLRAVLNDTTEFDSINRSTTELFDNFEQGKIGAAEYSQGAQKLAKELLRLAAAAAAAGDVNLADAYRATAQALIGAIPAVQRMSEAINTYAAYMRQLAPVVGQAMTELMGMGDETAEAWVNSFTTMADVGTGLARAMSGDIVGGVVQGLSAIFGWLQRNRKAAEEAAQATKSYNEQFRFSADGYGTREVSMQRVGFIFTTDIYSETIDKLGRDMALSLESGVVNGISNGFMAALKAGDFGLFKKTLQQSVGEALLQGMVDAFVNQAIVAEIFGPAIKEFLATGNESVLLAAIDQAVSVAEAVYPKFEALIGKFGLFEEERARAQEQRLKDAGTLPDRERTVNVKIPEVKSEFSFDMIGTLSTAIQTQVPLFYAGVTEFRGTVGEFGAWVRALPSGTSVPSPRWDGR